MIVARRDVVPEVSAAILKRELPKRRYAIGFLGIASDSRALPNLERVLDDPSENPVIRGDALEAIAMIRPSHGRALAAKRQIERTI